MTAARTRRGRRRTLAASAAAAAAVVVAGVLALPGLADLTDEPDTAPAAGTVPDGPADPADLLGTWRVTGATDLEGDTWLRVDPTAFRLDASCGSLDGTWAANGRTILMSPRGSSWCPDSTVQHWLLSVSAYAATDGGWTLTGADGAVLGTLGGTGDPRGIPQALREPLFDAGDPASLAEPAPLPAGVRPAPPDDVVGRWVPADGATGPDGAFVVLTGEGRWYGHDGCQEGSGNGRWALGASGRVLSTEHARLTRPPVEPAEQTPLPWPHNRTPSDSFIDGRTVDACPAVQAASLVAWGARLGVDGEELVALDRDGSELGRLVREDREEVVDLEAACGGSCEPRPHGWDQEQAALLGPIVDRLRAVAEPHAAFVDVGPEYGTSDLVLYWGGPLAPEVQAVVDEAAAAGVTVRHQDDRWPGWPQQAPVSTAMDALQRAGLAMSVAGNVSKYEPGIRVQGPIISEDPAVQEAARAIVAHVVGPEIPVMFEPFEGYTTRFFGGATG